MIDRQAALLRRRSLQYSLRTLLVLITPASVALGWVALQVHRASDEREAARAISSFEGWCIYDYDGAERVGEFSAPAWLRAEERLLGSDLLGFRHITEVYLDCDTFANERNGTDVTPAQCAAACKHLASSTRLRSLWLTGDKVTDACLGFLDRSPPLTVLTLDECEQVTDAGLAHLEGLSKLESLCLRGTQATDAGLRHLAPLGHLRWLDLGGTRVTDAGLKFLRGNTGLKHLDLSRTRITGEGLPLLAGLTHLEELWLIGTAVTAEGKAKLKRALPKCHIRDWRSERQAARSSWGFHCRRSRHAPPTLRGDNGRCSCSPARRSLRACRWPPRSRPPRLLPVPDR